MFDLKYYNELSRSNKFFDEFKGNAFSRQNLHKINNMQQKHIWNNMINDLPYDYILKGTIEAAYKEDGENGLAGLHKAINKIQMNRSQE
jgi:hypothetical protein